MEDDAAADVVQGYFMVLHEMVSIVLDYLVEVSKNPEEYNSAISLAASTVVGHFLLELPELCTSDPRIPKVFETIAGTSVGSESTSFGWTYLAPAISQVR